ncbi:heme ABC transporter ATP-binding protein [Salinispirillum sp. LH 10-3-1]|uniref:Heme ABC transporter ATP-binding protein n=1 Tax=Salinispirillum sp. LH 10-3-1 TaxID=2952525 RepID=A0AB38YIE7_9GAMM
MIKAENLTVRLHNRDILQAIHCALMPGELVCVVGCNGAGKSTLLSALCGDLPAHAGHVTLQEQPLAAMRHATLARIRAVMPQKVQLDFPFPSADVVAMGRMPVPENSAQTRHAVRECMLLTETLHLADRPYPSLSGGEQQRVQLARVLAQLWPFDQTEPRYLFLDETTASLDPLHQQKVFELALSLTHQRIGVLAVVHDMNLAAQFADRVWMLQDGLLVADGGPIQTLTPDRIARVFGGLQVSCDLDSATGRPWIRPVRAVTQQRQVA